VSKLVSKQCVDFVKGFEGFSATPYYDEVLLKTLGYGMTGSEITGLSYVTEAQATSMLEELLNNNYAAPIKANLDSNGVQLNQNQFDALVSMAYNIGVGGLLGSTLYRNICKGVRDVAAITSNFIAWSRAGGQQLAGLLRRRQEEAAMFFGTGNQVDETNAIDILLENVKDTNRVQLIKALQWDLNADYNAKLKHVECRRV
jgi:GH24 family phage-related lysozyme (muramidase)